MTGTDEFLALEAAVRAVAADRIPAGAGHPDRTGAVPEPALRALWEMGLLAPRGVADGGDGVPDHLSWTAIAEALAGADAGTALDVVLGGYAAVIVDRLGDQEQRRVLAERGTVLYYEGHGRSPLELRATGGSTLSGTKTAVRADASGYAVVIVGAAGRPAAVLLDGATLGALKPVRDDPLRDNTVAGTLGARAAATALVDLAGAAGTPLRATPSDDVELDRCVAGMRLAVASILVGLGATAVDYAARYAAQREAFGRAIADFQGVSFPLVDADIAVRAARLAIRELAAGLDGAAGPPVGRTADPERPSDREPAVDTGRDAERRRLADDTADAVAGATQAATLATATAVNTLGGHGYLTDHPVERWYRDAAVLAALDFDPLRTDWSR